MNTPEIHDELRRMLGRFVNSPGLEFSDGLKFGEDIEGWDSFKFVELLIEAQERFEVQLSARSVERIETFGDLVAEMAEARAARAKDP